MLHSTIRVLCGGPEPNKHMMGLLVNPPHQPYLVVSLFNIDLIDTY